MIRRTTLTTQIIEKLQNRTAVIGIVGLGYVGLPLAIRFAEKGFKVVGFDTDTARVKKLNAGKSYIGHIRDDRIEQSCEQGFSATTNISEIINVDAIILCLPTPLNKYREPDLTYIRNTVKEITPYLRPNQVLSLESTTYPGTTEEEILPSIDSRKLAVGENFYLVYSPEREDPNNARYSTKNIPKICAGYTKICLQVGVALYEVVIDEVVPVSSLKTAELTKLLENIYRAINIGFINEMKIVADEMDIDIHEVIKAARTKPFGFTPFYPGPGLGGHCIPIDPFYLTWKAKEFGINTRFIELAGEVNAAMPDYVISKIQRSLNTNKKSIQDSKILLLGLAYKKNIDDVRESPSLSIMSKLFSWGADVSYSDPHIPVFFDKDSSTELQSVKLEPNKLMSYDCVVVLTDHDGFDFQLILENSTNIVDTRGIYDRQTNNVTKA